MALERRLDPKLIQYQERGFNPFTEVVPILIEAGKDKVSFPADMDFKSDKTKIIGMRAYTNNSAGSGKSFLSGEKLFTQDFIASAGLEIFENNTDRIYRFPLEKLIMDSSRPYEKVFIQGYSSKESRLVLGKPATETMELLLEFIYE